MQRSHVVALVAALAVGGIAGAVAAEDSAPGDVGARRSHVSEEIYDLELGVTISGRPGLPTRHRDVRAVMAVPAHYGELVQVAQDGHDSVLWYRDGDGNLRNVVLPATSTSAYRIQRVTPSRLEQKVR